MSFSTRAFAAVLLVVCLMIGDAGQGFARSSPAERRIALLIGNDDYSDPSLRSAISVANVRRDLSLLETAFRKVGFDVEVLLNATAQQTRDRLRSLALTVKDLDVAIVYFTGFGVTLRGINYLAGIDVRPSPRRPDNPENDGFVSLTDVALAIQSARKFSMIIAESNRSDPWENTEPSRSLVLSQTADDLATDSEVVIFYGSQEGSGSMDGPPGGNAPFAAAIAKRMVEPGIEVGLFARRVRADVMRATSGRQRPQLYGELGEREFYFSGAPVAPEAPRLIFSDQPRLALVIGNYDYNHDNDMDDDHRSVAVRSEGFAPDLPNTANDARDVKAALERLKFKVDFVENADYSGMITALLAFEQKIVEAGIDAIVVVYYAGHAMQVNGANFLVPVGSKLPPVDLDRMTGKQAEFALTQYALPLQTALFERLKNPSQRGLNLVILDACRDNPWEGRKLGRGVAGQGRGLSEVQADLRRTAVAFATQPGDVALDGEGANSPYTSALKAFIEQPGLTVLELLNDVAEKVETDTKGDQVPWFSSAALGRTCLGACPYVR